MPFEMKQGDTRPYFVVVLKDDFGEPSESIVDLSTAGTALFNMRQAGGTVVKVNRMAGTITNKLGGEVTYMWGTADTNTVGTYEAEVEVLWNDGKPETFPSSGYWTIIISDDIA